MFLGSLNIASGNISILLANLSLKLCSMSSLGNQNTFVDTLASLNYKLSHRVCN